MAVVVHPTVDFGLQRQSRYKIHALEESGVTSVPLFDIMKTSRDHL